MTTKESHTHLQSLGSEKTTFNRSFWIVGMLKWSSSNYIDTHFIITAAYSAVILYTEFPHCWAILGQGLSLYSRTREITCHVTFEHKSCFCPQIQSWHLRRQDLRAKNFASMVCDVSSVSLCLCGLLYIWPNLTDEVVAYPYVYSVEKVLQNACSCTIPNMQFTTGTTLEMSWCFKQSLSDQDSHERQSSGPQATPTTSLVGDCDLWNGCISHHETVSQD